MNPDHAQFVKQLFQRAVALPPEEREQIFARECRDDPTLAAEARALIDADLSEIQRFLEGALPVSGDVPQPERIGGYQIVRRIGEGGVGVVYKAVQDSPRRAVALKLLKTGSLSVDSLRRFEYEAEVLANLTHPGIAQIYEFGSESVGGGTVPFFAMELIPGARPLTEYARLCQLETRQRLTLFTDVCDAVHYGHQKGVIHRDLKPSNIVVDSNGRARIIDFGVARSAVTDAADMPRHTSAGQIIGTLPYMSPEQARGGNSGWDIDVRSDVYSLGVVLYELLCDRLPYDVGSGNVLHAARVICEAAPIRPSAAHRLLRGDLETIVLKALSKDRNERYQTAGDLARDIRHWLAGEPIQARRDSTFYVLRKTVSRYRVAIGVLLGFIALVAGSTIVAWSLMIRAHHSQQEAQNNLRESLIAQARAIRQTGKLGQRFDALDALAKAAAIAPSLDARNEAIAAMARPDARVIWTSKLDGEGFFDSTMERCAVLHSDGSMTVTRTADDVIISHVPSPEAGMVEFHRATLTGRFLIRLYDPPAGDRRLEVWTVDSQLAKQKNDSDGNGSPGTDTSVSGTHAKLHFKLEDVPVRARFDISPDGKRLAVGRTDRAVHIYELESHNELQRIPLDRIPSYVTFDPTGRRLAMYHGHYPDAQILDLDSGLSQPAFESKNINWSVAWHPRGKLLAGANGRTIELWDAESKCRVADLTGHEATVVQVVFSPDGSQLLSYDWDGNCILWDARTRRPLLRSRLSVMQFRSDGRAFDARLCFGPPQRSQIFELGADNSCLSLFGSGDMSRWRAGGGAFHPTTGLLFAMEVAPGVNEGGFRIFDVAGRSEIGACKTPLTYPNIQMDPAGKFCITTRGGQILRWPIRVESEGVKVGPPVPIYSGQGSHKVQLCAGGRFAIAQVHGQSHFTVIDLQRDNAVRVFECLPNADWPVLSTNGHWAALGTWRGTSGEVWDIQQGKRVAELPMFYSGSAAFSPDNNSLVTVETSGVCLRDTTTWQIVRRATGVGIPQFSPDGRLLAVVSALPATQIRLLDGRTLGAIADLELPESYLSAGHIFSPDSTRLAVFTNFAGVVYVWDLRRIREQLALLKLDWSHPEYPRAEVPMHRLPPHIAIDSGDLLPANR